ncbi:sn-glycerol-3-phosphate transporter [Pseudomonas sp. B21-051]|nr:sn-glycerol-3-phosphate transporter [Pseudomonas sp. B21-051]
MPRLLTALLMIQAGHALAEDDAQGKGFWYAQTSVYTRHYSPDPEHNNHQDLIGIERNQASGRVFGGATFRNSFRQRSNYAYVGKRYDSSEYPLYLKVTGGLLQGYRGDYKDKIPLNRYGVAPVIIPSVGTHYGPLAAELVFLGANAAMVTSGVRF